MVNNISNVRGFKFHKELPISHHTQFLDKGGFVSQLLISEAVTFYCKFQAVEKIVISGITEHFYVVARYHYNKPLSYGNISLISLLYKTWQYYNKFDSMKSLGIR